MTLRNLVPSIWGKNNVPVRREEGNSVYSLQQEMNSLFDDFFRGFDMLPAQGMAGRFGAFSPSIDIKENEKEITVKAELPGLDEKDVEVHMADNTLTIKGEKKKETEDKGQNYYHLERSYGSFQRVIPLHVAINEKQVDATFKNGILTINLPKKDEAMAKGKKIAIKTD
ncbi:MAG TPA: molecular chaperone [Syntrophus sp. (in: bacteria)]|nr:molecular chaperone [Syntrophus sp. (in: bacteria)]